MAPVRSASSKFASVKSASVKLAPVRSAPTKVAPLKLTSIRSYPDKLKFVSKVAFVKLVRSKMVEKDYEEKERS